MPSVPFLWKGRQESGWQYADGARYVLASGDPDVIEFHAWLDGAGGQHPDMRFVPAEPLTLASGESYAPSRTMSAIGVAQPVSAAHPLEHGK